MFDIPGPTFVLGGRRGRRVLRGGEDGRATITGIRVSRTEGDETEPAYTYALTVRPAGGGETFACGVRQRLTPHRERGHVGAEVPVRIRGRKVVIDWETVVGNARADVHVHGWKMDAPPSPGVEDRRRRGERKRIAGARAAQAVVLSAEQAESLLGPLLNVDLDVELRFADDGSVEQRRLERVDIPSYVRALVTPGLVLPAGVDRDGRRVTIDWEAVACALAAGTASRVDPGSLPAVAQLPRTAPVIDRAAAAATAFVSGLAGAGTADPAAPEISLDQYVAISVGLERDRVAPADHDAYAARHGIPAGTWAAVHAGWQRRIMSDWQVGAAYGEAYAAARKR